MTMKKLVTLVILGEAFLAKCHTKKSDYQAITGLVIFGDNFFHAFYV